MPQMSIYLDEETLKRVRQAADREDKSVSEWVRDRLSGGVEDRWPEGYFDVFGSIGEDDLERPEQVPFDRDRDRETF